MGDVRLTGIVWDDPHIGTLYLATDDDVYPKALVYVAKSKDGLVQNSDGNPILIHYHAHDYDIPQIRFCEFINEFHPFPRTIRVGTKFYFDVNALNPRYTDIPIRLFQAIWKWCANNPNNEKE